MSKIGKKPIIIPQGVTIEEQEKDFLIKGPKGEVKINKIQYVKVAIKDNQIELILNKNIKQGRSNWGTLRSLLNGAVIGVTAGFIKNLEINGVGMRYTIEGKNVILNVGFSHPVKFPIPDGITIEIEKNIMKISGFNKDLVGRTAANIRAIKKPEPYKGKGIKYVGEIIIRKAGKKTGA
ncbi:MAG: 50S ribosomal protein L6 [Candidatus Liptonbacteria bacterium CG11_big_fil_rev_8_21_14_0_20_35_14]|uniref:50S ribosomal protein L6 n=1 Tax=Candidatus Liptonbacteria bacterium CG11_big_fil_rev_8_21_14_0_20_35_14 TaxID=1974634 RepID=A0A2H0N892_9BACT|nr:MAG: 50S ribosomal protein L6 [Candidatus Liptonbacteria bacterium CG11_big_fil_rev_8_21_14_0_20_35_14]